MSASRKWAAALALTAACALLPSRSSAREPQQDPVLSEIESHFHAAKKWFGMVADLAFDRGPEGTLAPRFETLHSKFVLRTDAAGQTLTARLPPTSATPLLVRFNGTDGFTVRTVEIGVPAAPVELRQGVVVYRGAVAGGDLLYKLTPTHVDEYLYLKNPPAHLRREFEFEVGPAVLALREAGDMIEVLGKDGIARLRLSSPLARAADGARRRGTVRVVGRTIVEDIDLTDLKPPVLVDPDWSTTGTMTSGRWADAAWRWPDGRVMTVAGCSLISCPQSFAQAPCAQVIASTEIWDPTSGTWTSGPPLATARYAFGSSPLPSGGMIVAGGCTTTNCSDTTATAERFDVASSMWLSAGTLALPRANLMSATLESGSVLLAGGCDATGCTTDAERWDLAGNVWTGVSPLPAARGFASATTIADGRVLITGGCADTACKTVLDDAVLYDPKADSWTPAGTMAAARAGHAVTLLQSGDVLVTGGCSDAACSTVQTSAEIWSPGPGKGGTFAAAPAMTGARHHHVATLLKNGEVLVAGGADPSGASVPSSEVYLPLARQWIDTSAMLMSRAYHVGVGLLDGRVLEAGGCNPQTCMPWAEVFSPATLPPDSDAGVTYDAGPPAMTDAGDGGPAGPAPMARSPHPPLYRDGVVTCATDDKQDLPCPVDGWELQDGDFQPNREVYATTADEVTDQVTGLAWQAGGDGKTYDQASAARYCSGLATSEAPAGSFRLPTVVELMTIVDYGVVAPSIDPSFTGAQPTNYWTATPVVATQRLAWTVKFDAGEVIPLLMDTSLPVRCVRGTSALLGAGGVGLRKAGPLRVTGDTVVDDTTRLEWQARDDGIKRNWKDSLSYCSRLSLAGKTGWHLANVSELLGITQYDKMVSGVAADPVFQNTKADLYWTSSQNEGAPTLSWSVTFNLGIVDGVTVSGLGYARCVRHLDEVPPAPVSFSGGGCGCVQGPGGPTRADVLAALGGAFAMLGWRLRRRHTSRSR